MHARLAAKPRCVGAARRLTHTTLQSWGLATLGDVAVLLVSELTTNAILHAHSTVGIQLQTNPTGVRVDICDDSPVPPQLRRYTPEAATGRGVRLLQSLADTWGVQQSPAGGKCVWFTLVRGGQPEIVEWEFDVSTVEAL